MNYEDSLKSGPFKFQLSLENIKTRAIRGIRTESVNVLDSLGRVPSEDVLAESGFPSRHISRITGYAVRSADLEQSDADHRVTLRSSSLLMSARVGGYGPGVDSSKLVLPVCGLAATHPGFPLNEGADSVIPVDWHGCSTFTLDTAGEQLRSVDRPFEKHSNIDC